MLLAATFHFFPLNISILLNSVFLIVSHLFLSPVQIQNELHNKYLYW